MLPGSTNPAMPMGSAATLPLSTADLMPAMKAPSGATPPAAAGLQQTPSGAPAGGFPSPDAPAQAPYDVKLQADGSSVYVTKTNPPVVVGVNKAPALPKAFQQQ